MFYTSVYQLGDNILFRGVNNGKRISKKIPYQPKLYAKAKSKTGWQTLENAYLEELPFSSISEAKDFIKKYDGIPNFEIFGMTKFSTAFVAEAFPGQIKWDVTQISIAYLDIEVASDDGFPEPDRADKEITAITVIMGGRTLVFGCGNYSVHRDDIEYFKCSDEISLIKAFVSQWTLVYPDVLTGWNTKFFDIPYLVNRITRLLGEDFAKKLSPWGKLSERKADFKGKELKIYEIMGVAALDYLELYRKFAPNPNQDNYRLDTIAHVELDEGKIDYSEYDSLHALYLNNYQLFIEYNVKDVDIVVRLEGKMKLIELALTLAYDSKVNYDDVFSQGRMWDSIIYNHLRSKGIIIPPKNHFSKDTNYAGAFVKDPNPGMYDWVVSFDLASLYPSLIMMYNISPETLVKPEDYTEETYRVISQQINVSTMLIKKVDTSKLKTLGVTITPNAQMFRTDKEGFLPYLMREMFADRQKYKKEMLKYQQEYEVAKKEGASKSRLEELTNLISRYQNLQMVKKICLNSCYGSMGSPHFRFFDIRIAEAITLSGQLTIKWIDAELNSYLNKILKTDKDFVIGADTDSCFIHLGPLMEHVFGSKLKGMDKKQVIRTMDKICKDKLTPFIDESYQELANYTNAYEQTMNMKREKLADRAIWTGKKRYIINVYDNEGVEYNTPKMGVTGLEAIRSSTPTVCREKLKEGYKILLEKDEEDAIKFVESFREEFKKLPLSDIAFPRGVNGMLEYGDPISKDKLKSLDKDDLLRYTPYKLKTPIHVKGSLIYNHLLDVYGLGKKFRKVTNGDKIKFIYLKQPNRLRSNVIAFIDVVPDEFGLSSTIDFNTQFEKTFLDPFKIVLDAIGWKSEDVSSLEDLFG